MTRNLLIAAALGVIPVGPALAAPTSPAPRQSADAADKAALAEAVAAVLWPDGTYTRMVDAMFGEGKTGLAGMFLDMRPAEIMSAVASGMAGDGKTTKPAPPAKPGLTLREQLIADDPHFEERTRIAMNVIRGEVDRIARPIEPKFRAGLAKSIARRFTREQLGPIAAFFQSEAGKAYAAQSMTLFMDKDVVLAMVQSIPAIVKEMPGAMDKVEKATAHLPKPKKKPVADGEEDNQADEAAEDRP